MALQDLKNAAQAVKDQTKIFGNSHTIIGDLLLQILDIIIESGSLTQVTGNSATKIMSQKAVTKLIAALQDSVTNLDNAIVIEETTSYLNVKDPFNGICKLGVDVTAGNNAAYISYTDPDTHEVTKNFLVTKKYVDDQVAQIVANLNTATADEKLMFPAVAYNKRTLSDGGIVVSKKMVIDGYKTIIDLLPNTDLLICPDAGIKIRTSDIYSYVAKAYNMGIAGFDVTQVVEANQPYLSGNIAPNERKAFKAANDKYININEIAKPGTQPWSITAVFNWDGNNILEALFGKSGYGEFRINNASNKIDFISSDFIESVAINNSFNLVGTASILNIIADGTGALQFWLNGKLIDNFVAAVGRSSLNITRLFMGNDSSRFSGKLYYFQVLDKNLSKSEIENQYNYLRSQYPEIEGVNIGNQHWATSNYEGVLTGNGTAIPEVRGISTITNPEIITNASDRDFSSDTGWWIKQSGWTILGGAANCDGTLASSNLYKNGVLISGRRYTITFKVTTLTQGSVRVYGSAEHNAAGTFTEEFLALSENLLIQGLYHFIGTIDNISIKEVGWADLTTPAWCYYNNDPALGSVYGKLYNYYAVQEIAKNPPKGWRVPSSADFVQLSTYLGGDAISGCKLKKEGFVYWFSPNAGATNESGLSLLPAGYRSIEENFGALKIQAILWSSLNNYAFDTHYNRISSTISNQSNALGCSLRLLRNSPAGDQIQNI